MLNADPENAKMRMEVREKLRQTVIRLVERCKASSTIRRALAEAASGDDLSDTQLMRVGASIGMSSEQIRALIAEERAENGNGGEGDTDEKL